MPARLDIGARSDVFLIRDFLTASECTAHIEASEARGYEEAAIATAAGQLVVKEVRNNDRILWDDAALAADGWSQALLSQGANLGLRDPSAALFATKRREPEPQRGAMS